MAMIRSKPQSVILALGCFAIAFMGAYPPWQISVVHRASESVAGSGAAVALTIVTAPADYHWIWRAPLTAEVGTPDIELVSGGLGVGVDWGRLIVQIVAVIAATLAAFALAGAIRRSED